MLNALVKAFAQLPDPRLRRVLILGVAGALAAYAALVLGAWAVLAHVTLFSQSWADWGADAAIGALALVLPALVFPAFATAIMGSMLEKVADAVEDRHYPDLNWPRPQGWAEILSTTLRFVVLMVVVNALALPVYLLLLIVGLTPVAVMAVNGYLLGREYFQLVALRRLDPQQAQTLFRTQRGPLWLAGIIIALLFSVPLLNLAAPIIATAFMVHLFQSFQSLRRQTDLL